MRYSDRQLPLTAPRTLVLEPIARRRPIKATGSHLDQMRDTERQRRAPVYRALDFLLARQLHPQAESSMACHRQIPPQRSVPF